MNTYKKSMFALEVGEPNRQPGFAYLYHTLNGAFAIVDEKAWPAVTDEPFPTDGGDAFRVLSEQGFILPSDTDEIALFDLWKKQHVHDYSTIKSKVLVTRRCNLACRYCVLEREASHMTPETALAMDRFYIGFVREKGPSLVVDNYLGGEPLLNPQVIAESASRRFYFCDGKGIEYRFSITTNGTLLSPDVVKRLSDAGLSSIKVSLAGPGEVHDRLRPFSSGKGSYSSILENLKRISGLVPVSVECQYDSAAEDYRQIPRMLDRLAEEGVSIEDIAFTPILPRRTDNRFTSGFDRPEIQLSLYREAAARGLPVCEHPPRAACMADFRSQMVFDADGSIIPCPSLQSGEMSYGHVKSGVDFVRESQLIERRLPEKCLSCELLPLCQGGCRLQALTRKGDFGGVDCNYEAFKMQVEEYVRQKGRRFLENRLAEAA